MKTVPLGEIADLQAGVGFPPPLQGRTSGDLPMAKVGDISRTGRSGQRTLRTADNFVMTADLAKLRTKPIPPGATLFAKIGEAIRANHRVMAGCDLLIDNNAMAAIPRSDRVDSTYLYHFLKSVDFYRIASSTTVPSLRKSDLSALPVPLPPLPEQRRIASILDRIDMAIQAQEQSLRETALITSSYFRRTQGHYPSAPLEDLISDWQIGLVRSAAEQGQDRRFGYLKMDGITSSGQLSRDGVTRVDASDEEAQRFSAVDGDLLFNTRNTRDLVGKSAIFHGDPLILNNNIARIRFDQTLVLPEFIHAFLWSPEGRARLEKLKSGTTNVWAIYAKSLMKLPIPIAPMMEQQQLRRISLATERIGEQNNAQIVNLKELKAALTSRAFRGELR